MIIKTLPLGPMDANTYVLIEESSGACAVIDAADCTERLLSVLRDERIKSVDYILLTHGHFDHTDGVRALKKEYPDAKVVIHKNDAPMLSDAFLSLASVFGAANNGYAREDIRISGGEKLPFGSQEISVIHTPGHTRGGVCYIIDNCIFSGDTLFCRSVGRTDFPGGDYEELNDSVCRLFDLDGDYIVYPGHFCETTLDYERKHNGYVRWQNR